MIGEPCENCGRPVMASGGEVYNALPNFIPRSLGAAGAVWSKHTPEECRAARAESAARLDGPGTPTRPGQGPAQPDQQDGDKA